jgi:hypothetical protein
VTQYAALAIRSNARLSVSSETCLVSRYLGWSKAVRILPDVHEYRLSLTVTTRVLSCLSWRVHKKDHALSSAVTKALVIPYSRLSYAEINAH